MGDINNILFLKRAEDEQSDLESKIQFRYNLWVKK